MKALLNILIVIIGLQGFSQTEIPLENYYSPENDDKESSAYYYKDVNGVLNKFLGTWRYQSNTELFEITFTKKIKKKTGMGYYKDELTCRYKYIKNGQVIYNTYTMNSTPNSNPDYFIFGKRIRKEDLNTIKLTYNEPSVRGTFTDVLVLKHFYRTRDKIESLDWFLDVVVDEDPDNPGEYISGYKVPYEMILTKIE